MVVVAEHLVIITSLEAEKQHAVLVCIECRRRGVWTLNGKTAEGTRGKGERLKPGWYSGKGVHSEDHSLPRRTARGLEALPTCGIDG